METSDDESFMMTSYRCVPIRWYFYLSLRTVTAFACPWSVDERYKSKTEGRELAAWQNTIVAHDDYNDCVMRSLNKPTKKNIKLRWYFVAAGLPSNTAFTHQLLVVIAFHTPCRSHLSSSRESEQFAQRDFWPTACIRLKAYDMWIGIMNINVRLWHYWIVTNLRRLHKWSRHRPGSLSSHSSAVIYVM